MASISERESREIEAANASGTTPVVFIHGLWLLAEQLGQLGLAGRGLSAVTVAIDPGVFRRVLPLPLSTLRAAGPLPNRP